MSGYVRSGNGLQEGVSSIGPCRQGECMRKGEGTAKEAKTSHFENKSVYRGVPHPFALCSVLTNFPHSVCERLLSLKQHFCGTQTAIKLSVRAFGTNENNGLFHWSTFPKPPPPQFLGTPPPPWVKTRPPPVHLKLDSDWLLLRYKIIVQRSRNNQRGGFPRSGCATCVGQKTKQDKHCVKQHEGVMGKARHRLQGVNTPPPNVVMVGHRDSVLLPFWTRMRRKSTKHVAKKLSAFTEIAVHCDSPLARRPGCHPLDLWRMCKGNATQRSSKRSPHCPQFLVRKGRGLHLQCLALAAHQSVENSAPVKTIHGGEQWD